MLQTKLSKTRQTKGKLVIEGTTACDFCNVLVPNKIFQKHYKRCMKRHNDKKQNKIVVDIDYGDVEEKLDELMIKCEICQKDVNILDINTHEVMCLQEMNTISKISCAYCNSEYSYTEIEAHEFECLKTQTEAMTQNEQYSLLNPTQMNALTYVNEKNKKVSDKSRDNVIKKCKLSPVLFNQVLERFASSNIIINFHPNKHLHYFLKDTNYRNLFETGHSSGSTNKTDRAGWEDGLFNSIYENAKGAERCKYGALNLEKGQYLNSANYYGDSYFVLKHEVKLRSTYTYGDSSSTNNVYSFMYPEAFLSILPPNFVKEMSDKENINTSYGGVYIEVQIHGDLVFSRDILAIVADDRHKGGKTEKDLMTFVEKNDIMFSWKSDVVS